MGTGAGNSDQNHWNPFEGSLPTVDPDDHGKKEHILLAAASLFADKGYVGTSVREIVEAAGVTKPTLYYYFKNKEDLYVQLISTAILTFSQIVQEAAAQPGTMRARFLLVFSNIYHLFREHIDLLRLVNSMIYGPRGATPAYDLKPSQEFLERVFSEILKSGIETREINDRNSKEMLLLLFGLLRSIQVLLVLDPTNPVLGQGDIERVIDFIFDGAKALYPAKEKNT